MARFNHSKVNMQKRISYENHTCDNQPRSSAPDFESRPYKRCERWLWMPFGKHQGKTLPQVVPEDPGYIEWLYAERILLNGMYMGEYPLKLAHQLEVIHNRMTHIRPPPDCEFAVVVDRQGVFESFIVVKRGRFPKKPLRKGSKIIQRLHLLDIGIPSQFGDTEKGFEQMALCLKEFFFGDRHAKVTVSNCKAIIEDNRRFDLSASKYNKRLKASARDIAALKGMYRRWRKRRA